MLSELIIQDFVLVKRAVFSFGPGLTVITGATGAGKSLFVKALKLLLGDRADISVLRPGAQQATIQALFEIREDVEKSLLESGIATEGELVVRRVIQAGGRSRIFLNGVLVTLSQLREMAPKLAGIASQHEFQHLLKRERHLEILDDFGNLEKERLEIKRLYQETTAIKRALEELRKRYENRDEERERILRERKLIDDVNPREGEEEELEQERRILRASTTLRELGEEIYARLYAARESITEELSACRASMEKMAQLDPELQPVRELMESLSFQADDLAISIRDYIQALPLDISRLEQVEERLFRLQGLRKKFGPEISDVLSHREALERQLKDFQGIELEIEAEEKRLQKAGARLCRAAADLSRRRRLLAAEMEQAVMQELRALDLSRARFKIQVETPAKMTPEDIGPWGADRVEFFFSANPGQPLRPLGRVASGGELSRILLAIKTVSIHKGMEETLIFDEIDAGLGGEIAENVGKKLRDMGKRHQVIAITHFPQIAALADTHLAVEKTEKGGKTLTGVRRLSEDERLQEILRMLGGDSESARRYASELLGPVLGRS